MPGSNAPDPEQHSVFESYPVEGSGLLSLVHHLPLKYHNRLSQVVGAGVVVVGSGVEDVGEDVDGDGVAGLGVGITAEHSPLPKLPAQHESLVS